MKVTGSTNMKTVRNQNQPLNQNKLLAQDVFFGIGLPDKKSKASIGDPSSLFYPPRYFSGLPRLTNQDPKPKPKPKPKPNEFKELGSEGAPDYVNITKSANVSNDAGETNFDARDSGAHADAATGADAGDDGSSESEAKPTTENGWGGRKAPMRGRRIGIGVDVRGRRRKCRTGGHSKGKSVLTWGWKWGRWKLLNQVDSTVPRANRVVDKNKLDRKSICRRRFNSTGISDKTSRAVLPNTMVTSTENESDSPVQMFEYHGVKVQQKILPEAELHLNDLL